MNVLPFNVDASMFRLNTSLSRGEVWSAIIDGLNMWSRWANFRWERSPNPFVVIAAKPLSGQYSGYYEGHPDITVWLNSTFRFGYWGVQTTVAHEVGHRFRFPHWNSGCRGIQECHIMHGEIWGHFYEAVSPREAAAIQRQRGINPKPLHPLVRQWWAHKPQRIERAEWIKELRNLRRELPKEKNQAKRRAMARQMQELNRLIRERKTAINNENRLLKYVTNSYGVPTHHRMPWMPPRSSLIQPIALSSKSTRCSGYKIPPVE